VGGRPLNEALDDREDAVDPVGVAIAGTIGVIGYVLVHRHQRVGTADGIALGQLRASGSDTSKPHRLCFYFFSEERRGLESIASVLAPKGFSTDILDAGENGTFTLCATRQMVPRVGILLDLREMFGRLAASNHARYDGWDAELVS